MRLSRLQIDRLPGLNHPFTLDFHPGVNLVTGPNGSGKSSLTRAVFHLLWPDLQDITPCEVTADFQVGGEPWQAVASGPSQVKWWHQDAPADRPGLPGKQVAPSYRLGLLDLALPERGQDDRVLARRIRQEMDGGFDLTASENALFTVSGQIGGHEYRKLKIAQADLREIRTKYRDLAGRERSLDQKEQQWKLASKATVRAAVIKNLLDQRQRQMELETLRLRLAAFPPGVAFVNAEDPASLANLRKLEQETRRALADHEAQLAVLLERQAALALPSTGAEPFSLGLLNKLIDALQSARLDHAVRAKELAGWDAVTGQAVPGQAGPQPVAVDQKTYSRLLELHQDLAQNEAKRAAWEGQKDDGPATALVSKIPAMAAIFVGMALILYGLWQNNGNHIAILAFLTGAAATAGGAFLLGRAKTFRQDRPGADLAVKLAVKLDQLAADKEQTLAKMKELAELHQLDLDNPSWIHDLKQLGRRLENQQTQSRIQGEVQKLAEVATAALTQVNQELVRAGVGPVDSLETARQMRDNLDQRLQELAKLDGEIKASQQAIAGDRRNLDQTSGTVESLFQRLQLDPTAEDTQVALLAQAKPEWDAARQKSAAVMEGISTLENLILEHPELLDVAAARRRSIQELNDQITLELEDAQAEVPLQQEIAAIKSGLQNARAGDTQEKAQAAEEACRLALEAKRDEARRAALGRLLLGQVRRQSETRSRPPVLREAMGLFSTFTGRRYELLVATDDDGLGSFRAKESDTGHVRELGELSDGTRTQLLLAVRLGFIFQSESAFKPPLFLDDTLTSSDPERFAAIAVNLGQLSQDRDRQVIFLTPNPVDAAAWQQAVQGQKLPAAHLIDLAVQRRLAVMAPAGSLEPTPLVTIPSPGTSTPQEYGALLQVPALDPWAAATAAHLFYLLEDQLDLLHAVLAAGAPTVGRWLAGRRSLIDSGVLTEPQDELLDTRRQIWTAVLEAWRVGRARPVTMADIDDSGAVSTTMRERVAEALANCRGDGKRFLIALWAGEVKGLRDNIKKQLQEYLELQNLIPLRETQGDEAMVLQVLGAVSPQIRKGNLTTSQLRNLTLGLAHRLDR